MKKVPFFVIDGGDGAGKSTLIARLKKHFGDRLVATREPGGCPRAEAIRTEIFAHGEWSAQKQFDEFWRARGYHLEDTIQPALEAGRIVISDRFDSSTFAYQLWEKNHPELIESFWEKRREVVGSLEPQLYLYLDLDVETGLARKAQVAGKGGEVTHFDMASVDAHKRRQEGYKTFFGYLPKDQVRIIDASRTADEVFDNVVKILESHLV
jgi:dTMP kinase